MTLIKLYSLVPILPLIAATITGLSSSKLPKLLSHGLPILGVMGSFLISIYALYISYHGFIFNETLYRWAAVGNYDFQIGFLIDNLTAIMMTVVTFVSLMVHIYTIGYMHDDPGYKRFFSYISLFTFAMLMLVMSNNFLQLFFGWEAVGLVSYLLIGFWFTKPSAIYANMKSFLVNRVGDFGFLLGIAFVLYYFGSLNYHDVFLRLDDLSGTRINFSGTSISLMTIIGILLFIGAMGKSAQVPLHVWLPDSMEGPTPISALIHAATMVTAGIFMVTRMSPIFELSDVALSFIVIVGGITALFMGILGIFQTDIKKVIAYSTLSQLGYMTVALGLSAYSVAIFHLFTHAFFKALLFLGAGSVIIGMHHDQDINHMGNIKKYMPLTWITFLLGTLALVGTPFFSGFYSKESIIEAAKHSEIYGSGFAYVAVLIGVFVTSLYSFRLYFIVFHGRERWRDLRNHSHKQDHHGLSPNQDPHESSWVITLPLILLAIPSVVIGYFLSDEFIKGSFLSESIYLNASHKVPNIISEHFHGAFSMAIHGLLSFPFLLLILGIFVAYLFFYLEKFSFHSPTFIKKIIDSKYGFDYFNENILAKVTRKLGQFFWYFFDMTLIDGFLVNGSAKAIHFLSHMIKKIQTGFVSHYAFYMMIGLMLFISYFIWSGGAFLNG